MISIFRRGLLGIRGDYFQGGLQFLQKHKLKCETFNEKMVTNKNAFPGHNLN